MREKGQVIDTDEKAIMVHSVPDKELSVLLRRPQCLEPVQLTAKAQVASWPAGKSITCPIVELLNKTSANHHRQHRSFSPNHAGPISLSHANPPSRSGSIRSLRHMTTGEKRASHPRRTLLHLPRPSTISRRSLKPTLLTPERRHLAHIPNPQSKGNGTNIPMPPDQNHAPNRLS